MRVECSLLVAAVTFVCPAPGFTATATATPNGVALVDRPLSNVANDGSKLRGSGVAISAPKELPDMGAMLEVSGGGSRLPAFRESQTSWVVADASTSASVSAHTAAANAAQASSAFEAISDLQQADLSVPVSPVAAVLGISADKVQRPGSIRELVASVVQGLGKDGKPQKGLALDIAPLFIFAPTWIHAGTDYAPEGASSDWDGTPAQRLHRILARTVVSFGTTEADSTGATRTAVGLRVGLFDSGDPGLYWSGVVNCVGKVDLGLPPPPGAPGQPLAPVEVNLDKCNPAPGLTGRPSLYFGYGQSWYSKSGALTDHVPNVKQFWLSGSWGPVPSKLGSDAGSSRFLGQLYLGRRLDDRAQDPSNASLLVSQDTTEAVIRLRGGRSNWHAFIESGRSRARLGNATTENLRHVGIGAEFQLSWLGKDNWLELASVSDRGFLDGKDRSGVMFSFRIGTSTLPLPGSSAGN